MVPGTLRHHKPHGAPSVVGLDAVLLRRRLPLTPLGSRYVAGAGAVPTANQLDPQMPISHSQEGWIGRGWGLRWRGGPRRDEAGDPMPTAGHSPRPMQQQWQLWPRSKHQRVQPGPWRPGWPGSAVVSLASERPLAALTQLLSAPVFCWAGARVRRLWRSRPLLMMSDPADSSPGEPKAAAAIAAVKTRCLSTGWRG